MAARKRTGPIFEVVVPGRGQSVLVIRTFSRQAAEEARRDMTARLRRQAAGRSTPKVEIDQVAGPTVTYPGAPLETVLARTDETRDGVAWFVLWKGESNDVAYEAFRDADDYARSLLDLQSRLGGLVAGSGEDEIEFAPARRRRHLNDPGSFRSRSRRRGR